MFTKKESYHFEKFSIFDNVGNTFEYEIKGNLTPLNNKEVSIDLDRESIKFSVILQELKKFKKEQRVFLESIFILEDKSELKIPFKYVGGGTADKYALLIEKYWIPAKDLGIRLLNE